MNSTAGTVAQENRLNGDTVEKLLFVTYNLTTVALNILEKLMLTKLLDNVIPLAVFYRNRTSYRTGNVQAFSTNHYHFSTKKFYNFNSVTHVKTLQLSKQKSSDCLKSVYRKTAKVNGAEGRISQKSCLKPLPSATA
uniref:Uncharacterized protein n=1 Tax=Romanomermis culicivorax TaxID=13658 RepID=A0A915IDI5_ROMCU